MLWRDYALKHLSTWHPMVRERNADTHQANWSMLHNPRPLKKEASTSFIQTTNDYSENDSQQRPRLSKNQTMTMTRNDGRPLIVRWPMRPKQPGSLISCRKMGRTSWTGRLLNNSDLWAYSSMMYWDLLAIMGSLHGCSNIEILASWEAKYWSQRHFHFLICIFISYQSWRKA